MNGSSPPYSPPSSDMDMEDDEDADAEGEEDEEAAAVVTATPPDLPTTTAVRSPVYDRQSPGTIDGLDSAQLAKLSDR